MIDITKFITRNTPTIIEVGAGAGEDIQYYSDLYPEGTLHCFEPDRDLYNIVLNRIVNRQNIKLHKKAVSVKTGEIVNFHTCKNNGAPFGASSLLQPNKKLKDVHPGFSFTVDSVETINLDDYIASRDIDTIDYLELDVQGFEPLIVESSPKTISKTKILYTEVNIQEIYSNSILYPEYKKMLIEYNFEIIHESCDEYQGNILLRNKNL
jgi:FkbM family methyltransferase